MEDDSLPALIAIPAGEFLMGSNTGEPVERPVHPVRLDEYLLGVHPVTVDQYARFLRESGHRPRALEPLPQIARAHREGQFRRLATRYIWRGGDPPAGLGSHPVTMVQYEDALQYCRWLSLVLGRPFRLPTEAEWERAARGGLDGCDYPWGSGIDPSRANFLPDISLKIGRGTEPVGSYPGNGLGLHDMAGNVWQWVSDWYDPHYYSASPPANPQGPGFGRLRLVRGGSWLNDEVSLLRCAHRHTVPPDSYSYSIGFRVASPVR